MTTTPLTAAQHAVWFTEQATAADGAYRMVLGIWFGPGLDEQALGDACAAVVERHPQLAAAVATGPDGPVLTTAAEKVTLTVAALTDGAPAARIAEPFDLRRGPLARFTLLTAGDRSLLLVTAHHLVLDGHGKDVLAHDLAEAYGAALAGRPSPLTTPAAGDASRDRAAADGPGPAADPGAEPSAAAVLDRTPTNAQVLERAPTDAQLGDARAYWSEHWRTPGQPLLPGLRHVPAATEPAATVEAELPAEVAAGLGHAAERLGVTRFELLLTAVHVVLAGYGNTGLPVTVALSTRPGGGRDRELGLHVNELPLAVGPLEGTAGDYARSLRRRLRELYAVRAVPIAQCVTGLRPSPALTPVTVSYRRQDREPPFTGVDARVDWSMHHAATAAALSLFIVDTPASLRIVARHSPGAIPADAVGRILNHVVTVLAAVIDDPAQPARALPRLTAAEKALLDGWNDTARPYPPHATVPTLLAAQVTARPHAAAVLDTGSGLTTLSYAALDAATRLYAARLREHGAGPGRLVAVSLPRSWQALVAVLAVLRCGAAYVPVDPSYPPARRALILDDAQPTLTVTDPAGAAGLPPGTAVLGPPEAADGAAPAAGGPGLAEIDPGALAYVMYTSGSTGRPKGVQVTHRALANLLLAMRDLLQAGQGDRWLALTSLSFDISGLELFLPLATGGQVVIPSGLSATDAAAVAALVGTEQVTHVQATPSAWRLLLDAGFDAPVTALAGGEALPLALARELRPRVRQLFNVYGPTETTIWSTAAQLPEQVDEVSIGRPLANTRAHLLDADGEPVPIGLTGELHLAGAGLAEGYLRRPELTAERFVGDPVRGRLYRTGDLCRFQPDGRLVYLGRADDQVKIRGHRVEPGDIEAQLRAHPDVAEAAVAARGEDVRLVAYVVARSAPPDPADLRRHLADRLPAVMVPTQWLMLDRLPRTPNGKLDRAALPEPPAAPQAGPVAGPPPGGDADEVTAAMRSIWAEVLKVPDIGLDDDLFDVGGHSLSITMISSRVQQRFGVQVPLDTFFDHPTVREIAAIVREQGELR